MRKSYVIFLLFFGIFFIPSNTFACGSHEKSCSKEVSTSKTASKSCCSSTQGSEEKDCDGSCGHSSCGCSSTCTTSIASIFVQYKFDNFINIPTIAKVNFYYHAPSLSEGHSSIWLIPKIS
ncbi:hypothetical protein ACFSX9_02305 [Flavobacterium ardleyense]|uniref:Uncharacterized protein n=1 Tax=Flavobacterium ardleyense TaxID=2038737 RepID=A0ABW5Z4B8_9FLAO